MTGSQQHSAAALPATARAVVFDAYGTLFDVHSAVARHADEIGPSSARLSEIWRAKQLEYSWVLTLAGRYEPFWTLTERALDYALARCPGCSGAMRSRLLEAYRSLDAYPEVAEILAGLRARGLRTAVLSNGDPGMLADAIAATSLGPLLDAVLSVEAAGAYKTSPAAYALAERALALRAADLTFVSSNRWDIAGAVAHGFPSIWVNRLDLPDEYPGLEPVAAVSSLRGLA